MFAVERTANINDNPSKTRKYLSVQHMGSQVSGVISNYLSEVYRVVKGDLGVDSGSMHVKNYKGMRALSGRKCVHPPDLSFTNALALWRG